MSNIQRPYYYFQPNQLSVRILQKTADAPQSARAIQARLATTDVGIDEKSEQPADSFTAIRNWVLAAAAKRFDGKLTPESTQFRPHSFADSKAEETVTALFVEFQKDTIATRSDIVSLANDLDKDAKGRDFGGATVEAVSLNWLGCGAGNGGWAGDGGPGGPPIRVSSQPGPDDHIFTPTATGNSKLNTGKDVIVAVIDTSPTKAALDDAYNKTSWGKSHPILKTLWGQNARLHLRRASDPTLARLAFFSLEAHPYDISDHGLFVAGIIHSIAPDADIYLYQALNDRGVCDCESVVEALDAIIKEHKENLDRLVINCSLFLLVPFGAGHFKEDLPDNLPMGDPPWNDPVARANWLKDEARFSEPIFRSIDAAGAGIYAAAGNDHKNGNRPEARFPAAFTNVVGVGADAADGTIASYSNEADEPPPYGIRTFGGELDPGPGMLGLYIGAFPDGKPSKNGWARWAGTSFATPVMTGITAAHFNPTGDNTKTVIGRVKARRGPGNRFQARQGP